MGGGVYSLFAIHYSLKKLFAICGLLPATVVSPTLLYNSVRPELVEGLSIFNNLRSCFDKLTTNDE